MRSHAQDHFHQPLLKGCWLSFFIPDPMALQLVDGPHRCAGRVEVLHQEEWGTVCDNGWDLQDAEVVCWQLGCGAAVAAPGFAHFGRGSDPIWLDEVNCTGTESALSECRAKPKGVHKCHHGEDAGAVCSGSCCSSADELLGGYKHCRSSRTSFPCFSLMMFFPHGNPQISEPRQMLNMWGFILQLTSNTCFLHH